jgi:hypothetical protein
MRVRGSSPLLRLVAVLALCAGCGDNSPTQPSASLAGSYSLTSFAFVVQGQQQTVPGATGSFTLTASTYTLDLTVPGQGTLHDTGTYSVSGAQWSQSSTTTGQATGTYALSGNQLTVDATSQGTESISVWQKQ